MHIHKWDKWTSVGVVETCRNYGGAIIQATQCKVCGKIKLRKTNSIISADPGRVAAILNTYQP